MLALHPGDKVMVVVNPVSGRTQLRRFLRALCRRMEREGFSVDVRQTSGPGDATAFAREGCRRSVRVLIVAGGDGTISEAVSGMEGDGIPILVLPGGTENIMAKYLGIQMEPDWIWRVLTSGRAIGFDVAAVNGRRFLLVVGIGFDAEVARRLKLERRGHITFFDYFWHTWRSVWSYRPPDITVEVDGTAIHQGPGWVFVGSLPRYALGVPVLARAIPDDGLLDVCAVSYRTPVGLWVQSLKIILQRHLDSRGVVYRQGRRVLVSSSPQTVPIQVDGDFTGFLPARFEMTSDRARFLTSPDWRR